MMSATPKSKPSMAPTVQSRSKDDVTEPTSRTSEDNNSNNNNNDATEPRQPETLSSEDTAGAKLHKLDTTMTDFVPPPMGKWQRRLTIICLSLTLFLSALDITIISTALPTIAKELGVTGQQYAWISSGFTLSSTASTPVWAKSSDIVGRKPIVVASAVVFMAGSLVAALADAATMLIAGRVLQGLGAGGSTVMVTVVIGDLFALKDRAKYYGITGIVWGIASAVGPVLGGVFSQTIGWRWCFFINLPFGGIAIIVLFFALKVEIEREPVLRGLQTLDWAGFVLILSGTILFLYALELGASNARPWSSAMIVCMLVLGFLLLLTFMLWESRFAKVPIIPGRIFTKTTNLAAFTLACLHSFVFISYDFFLPLYSQVILGFKPLISGVVLFALIVPLSVMPMAGAFVIRKTGNYVYLCYVGCALMTLGGGLFISFKAQVEWPKIILYQVITGVGAGLLFQSPMIALQSFLHQKDMAAAMSAYSFLRNLCTSVSVVIGAVLIQRSVPGASLTSLHGSGNDDDHGRRGGGGGGGGHSAEETAASEEAYMRGLRTMWTFYAAMSGLMLISSLFLKQTRPKPKEEAEEGDVQVVGISDEKNVEKGQ